MNRILQLITMAVLVMPASRSLSGDNPLRLEYRVIREGVLPYSPFLLKINIQNSTDLPVTLYTQPDYQWDLGLEISVKGGVTNNECVAKVSAQKKCFGCKTPITIPPHGSHPLKRELATGYGITDPGQYDLEIMFKAAYDEAGTKPFELHGSPLHLDIEQPNEADKKILGFFSQDKFGPKALCQLIHGLVPLSLLVKHPESGYISRQLRIRGSDRYSDDDKMLERVINLSTSKQPDKLRHDLGLDFSDEEDETHTLTGIRLHTTLLEAYLKIHPHDEYAALFWGNAGFNKLILNDLSGACESFSEMRKLSGDQVPKALLIWDTSEYPITAALPFKVMKALEKRNLCPAATSTKP